MCTRLCLVYSSYVYFARACPLLDSSDNGVYCSGICVYVLYYTYKPIHYTTYYYYTGAGSAGLGVCSQILDGLMMEGLSKEDALKKFAVFSANGVIGRFSV